MADAGLTVTSGLTLWLDANDMGVFSNGAAVITWPNNSASGLTVSATATRPTYQTAVLNSKPVVRTNGTNSGFAVSATIASLLGAGGQRTIIFVGSVASAAVGADDYSNPAVVGDADDGMGLFIKNTGTYRAQSYNYSTPANVNGSFSLSPDTFALSTGVMLEDTFDGSTMSTRQNGGTAGTVATLAPDGMASALRVAFKSGGGNFPGLDIAELLIYNRALNTTERRTVEQYLLTKWLPGTPLPPNDTVPTGRSGGWPRNGQSVVFTTATGTVTGGGFLRNASGVPAVTTSTVGATRQAGFLRGPAPAGQGFGPLVINNGGTPTSRQAGLARDSAGAVVVTTSTSGLTSSGGNGYRQDSSGRLAVYLNAS